MCKTVKGAKGGAGWEKKCVKLPAATRNMELNSYFNLLYHILSGVAAFLSIELHSNSY